MFQIKFHTAPVKMYVANLKKKKIILPTPLAQKLCFLISFLYNYMDNAILIRT